MQLWHRHLSQHTACPQTLVSAQASPDSLLHLFQLILAAEAYATW